MRTTPRMGPAAIKRAAWAELEGRYIDHERNRQLKRDQREVWEVMISQELATGKTCAEVGQEYNRCASTVSRIKIDYDRNRKN